MIVAYISNEALSYLKSRWPKEAIISTTTQADGRIAVGMRNDYFFRMERLMLADESISDAIIRTKAGTLQTRPHIGA